MDGDAAEFYKVGPLSCELVVDLGRRREDARLGMLSLTAWVRPVHRREVAISDDGSVGAYTCWKGRNCWYAGGLKVRTGQSIPGMRNIRCSVCVHGVTRRCRKRLDGMAALAGLDIYGARNVRITLAIPLTGNLPGIASSGDGDVMAVAIE